MKTNKLFSLMAVLFVAVLGTGFFSSCSSDDDDDNALVGTWVYNYTNNSDDNVTITTVSTITFNGDNTGVLNYNYNKNVKSTAPSYYGQSEYYTYSNNFSYNWDPEKSDAYGNLRVVFTSDSNNPNGYKIGDTKSMSFSVGGNALYLDGAGYIRQ